MQIWQKIYCSNLVVEDFRYSICDLFQRGAGLSNLIKQVLLHSGARSTIRRDSNIPLIHLCIVADLPAAVALEAVSSRQERGCDTDRKSKIAKSYKSEINPSVLSWFNGAYVHVCRLNIAYHQLCQQFRKGAEQSYRLVFLPIKDIHAPLFQL